MLYTVHELHNTKNSLKYKISKIKTQVAFMNIKYHYLICILYVIIWPRPQNILHKLLHIYHRITTYITKIYTLCYAQKLRARAHVEWKAQSDISHGFVVLPSLHFCLCYIVAITTAKKAIDFSRLFRIAGFLKLAKMLTKVAVTLLRTDLQNEAIYSWLSQNAKVHLFKIEIDSFSFRALCESFDLWKARKTFPEGFY